MVLRRSALSPVGQNSVSVKCGIGQKVANLCSPSLGPIPRDVLGTGRCFNKINFLKTRISAMRLQNDAKETHFVANGTVPKRKLNPIIIRLVLHLGFHSLNIPHFFFKLPEVIIQLLFKARYLLHDIIVCFVFPIFGKQFADV